MSSSSQGPSEPALVAQLQVPWVDSPFFDLELPTRVPPEHHALARRYRESGFLVLEDWFEPELLDRIRDEVEPLFDPAVVQGPRSRGRVQDAWRESAAVRALACHPRILGLLESLYGRAPFPFQTLNFRYGTEQRGHADRSHFDSVPGGFMCGVWVALEDVGPDNGPLFYYPGSQRIPLLTNDDLRLGYRNPQSTKVWDGNRQRDAVETFLDRLVSVSGLERRELTVKKGAALVWAAGLVHGGAPIRRPDSTRWSQVTHYYFDDCLYVTPMHANATVGDVYLREVLDVRTGQRVPHRYHDLEVQSFEGNGLYKLVLDLERVDGRERDVLRAIPHSVLKGTEDERDVLRQNVLDYRRIVAGLEEERDLLRRRLFDYQHLAESLIASVSFRLGRALTAPLRALRPKSARPSWERTPPD